MTDIAATSLPRPMSLTLIVSLLGITQIVGYGTVFYAYTLIAPAIAREFNTGPTAPFIALSVALLLSGLAGPFIGRVIDRIGAPRVMTAGSLAVACCYGLLSEAPGFAITVLLIVVLQVLSVAVLYGASFPTLAAFGGQKARHAITLLTLIAGFASTLYWPLTGWLVAQFDWRATFAVFGLMHLLVALPIHAWMARRAPREGAREEVPIEVSAGTVSQPQRRFAFWMVALSFAMTGVFSTALVVHLVPILELSGLGDKTYLVSMLIGPAMVGIRVAESVFAKRISPLATTTVATLCFPVAALILLLGLPALPAGIAFALIFGFGHGLNVIVGGTLPLALFGREGYGEMLGRLSAIRVTLSAAAPAVFSFGLSAIGFAPAMTIGIGVGLAGIVPLLALGHRLRAG